MRQIYSAVIKIGFAAVIGLLSARAFGASAEAPYKGAEATKKSYNAIFHVDSDAMSAMKKTLNNIRNLLDDPRLKGKVTVELLANSLGYKIYEKTNGLEKELKDLKDRGVILAECQNTLREKQIDPSTLYSFISLVPSGAGELTIREGNGWAYIHPSP